MRFSVQSFLFYFWQNMKGVDVLHHNFVCYVSAQVPLRLDALKEEVVSAVLLSFEKPIGTLTTTQQHSLIAGLLDTHYANLQEALLANKNYLKKVGKKKVRGGEVYEYQIDLRAIIKICKEIRVKSDCELIAELIDRDVFCVGSKKFVSLRKIQKLIYHFYGQVFAWRRIDEAFQELMRRDLINGPNGFRYRYGREVRT